MRVCWFGAGWCYQNPADDSATNATAAPRLRVSNGGVLQLLWTEHSFPLSTQSSERAATFSSQQPLCLAWRTSVEFHECGQMA